MESRRSDLPVLAGKDPVWSITDLDRDRDFAERGIG
jgi:hypothetical protein